MFEKIYDVLNLKYFWLEAELLPENMGYDLFSLHHLITLAFLFVFAVFLCWLFGRLDENKRKLFLRIVTSFLLVTEFFKICLMIFLDVFCSKYIPLYLCSMPIYLFPGIAFSNNPEKSKWADFAGTVTLLFTIPGSLAALFFPDWIGFYPPFSFYSLHSYFWHILIIVFPVCVWKAGFVTIKKQSILYGLIFLGVMVPLILVADRIFHNNFWFLERPSVNNPFVAIYEKTGYLPYLGCIIFMGTGMAALSGVIFYLLQRKGLRNKADIVETGSEQ